MWSKKWYLKRNMSCNAYLLNELLERDVPWDDAIVVSAGKLTNWTAQFSVWKTTGKDSSEACATARQNCAVYSRKTKQHYGMTHFSAHESRRFRATFRSRVYLLQNSHCCEKDCVLAGIFWRGTDGWSPYALKGCVLFSII
jgi:hypothetical protein